MNLPPQPKKENSIKITFLSKEQKTDNWVKEPSVYEKKKNISIKFNEQEAKNW